MPIITIPNVFQPNTLIQSALVNADFTAIANAINITLFGGGTTLTVGSGGTGLSSGTSGGLVYFSGAGTIASSSAYAVGTNLVGAGVGNAPAQLTMSTGQFLVGVTGTYPVATSFRTTDFVAPTLQTFTQTPSTTFGYVFSISTSTTCNLGDTYTNNSVTFTVLATLAAASGQVLWCTSAGAPAASGGLARASGAGTATITFASSVAIGKYTTPTSPRVPVYLRIKLTGPSGSGGASGGGSGSGSNGVGITGFGPQIMTGYPGGGGGAAGGAAGTGGSANIYSPAIGTSYIGNAGGTGSIDAAGSTTGGTAGGTGGSSIFNGSGAGGNFGGAGFAAASNSGSGGGGASMANTTGSQWSAGGGGAGGGVEGYLLSPGSTYYICVGTAGSTPGAGTNGYQGGAGSAGYIEVWEHYQ